MVGARLRSLHTTPVVLRCMWPPFPRLGPPARTSVGKCNAFQFVRAVHWRRPIFFGARHETPFRRSQIPAVIGIASQWSLVLGFGGAIATALQDKQRTRQDAKAQVKGVRRS